MPEHTVRNVAPETPLTDIMNGAARMEVDVLDHGLVALVDVMPRLVPEGNTADAAVVQAARVSYGQGTKKVNEDRGLIRYLLRHRHTTPFEMVELKFHTRMPIFVARQWIRHRTANVNEYSARYSVVPDRYYTPTKDALKVQSNANRQGGGESLDDATAEKFLEHLATVEAQYKVYEQMIEAGLARETARIALPVNMYTEWYWKIDLHNLLHFLSLRMDSHAQYEIQVFAKAMFELLRPIAPITCEAFEDYRINAVQLTALEVEALRTGEPLKTENKREIAEWEAKRGKFNR